MHLSMKNLMKLDLLQEDEEVTKYHRVEYYVTAQQQFKYPCIPFARMTLSETGDRTNGTPVDKMDGMNRSKVSHSSSLFIGQPQRTPTIAASTKSLVPSPYSLRTLSHTPIILENNPLEYGPSTTSLWHKVDHSNGKKRRADKQIQQQYKRRPKYVSKRKRTASGGEKRQVRQSKGIVNPGLRLLEKFTSPNIEIDHITIKHNGHPRPRVGLFNKGKSSAKGQIPAKKLKYTNDLVFSEASFLRNDSHPPTTPSINEPVKIAKDNDITTSPTGRSPVKKLPCFKSGPSIVISDSHSSKSINGFFEDPPKHSVNREIPITTVAPTTNCNPPDQIVSDAAQEPNIPTTIIEPVFIYPQLMQYQTDNHSFPVAVDSSDNRRLLYVPEPQIPYYSRAIKPNEPKQISILEDEASDTYTRESSSGSYCSNHHRSFSSSASLHAWDSASMVNSKQPGYHDHYESNNGAYDGNMTYQKKTVTTPSIFARLDGPKPFRPTIKNNGHRRDASSSTIGGSSILEQVPPRLRSTKPIYPVSTQPQRPVNPIEHVSSSGGSPFSEMNEITQSTFPLWQPYYSYSPSDEFSQQHQLYQHDQHLRPQDHHFFREQYWQPHQRDPAVGRIPSLYSPSSFF